MLYKLKIKQFRMLVHTNVKSVLHPLQQVWISGITAAEATIKTRSSKPSTRRDGTSAKSAKNKWYIVPGCASCNALGKNAKDPKKKHPKFAVNPKWLVSASQSDCKGKKN